VNETPSETKETHPEDVVTGASQVNEDDPAFLLPSDVPVEMSMLWRSLAAPNSGNGDTTRKASLGVEDRPSARELELEKGVLRLERQLAQIEGNYVVLRAISQARQRYITAIHESSSWRILERLRGLFGRRWSH
jgi:hypothetical protein